MKAFLQHDDSGLFLGEDGEWVVNPREALSFPTAAEAERFREREQVAAHAVMRLDASLLSRLSARAPGAYQVGE